MPIIALTVYPDNVYIVINDPGITFSNFIVPFLAFAGLKGLG